VEEKANSSDAGSIGVGGPGSSKVIRVRYEDGVLKPLEKLGLREGEEVDIILEDDIVEFARRIRAFTCVAERSLAGYFPGRGADLSTPGNRESRSVKCVSGGDRRYS